MVNWLGVRAVQLRSGKVQVRNQIGFPTATVHCDDQGWVLLVGATLGRAKVDFIERDRVIKDGCGNPLHNGPFGVKYMGRVSEGAQRLTRSIKNQ